MSFAAVTAYDMATPGSHGPRSYHKCDECRSKKRKCLPVNRPWPGQRCEACVRGGQPCGPNKLHDRLPPSSQPLPPFTPQSDLPIFTDDPSFTEEGISPFPSGTWPDSMWLPGMSSQNIPTPRPRRPETTVAEPRLNISAPVPKAKDSIKARLRDLEGICVYFRCLGDCYRTSVGVKTPRRFNHFDDVKGGLSASISSTLSEFERHCETIMLYVQQVSAYVDKSDILQRLYFRTKQFLQVSTSLFTQNDGAEGCEARIAAWHVRAIDSLAKHYQDSPEDSFGTGELHLEAASLRDRYGIPPNPLHIDEPAIFRNMSHRASAAFDAIKPKVYNHQFTRLFTSVSPAFPAAHVALCYQRPEAAKALLSSSYSSSSDVDLLKRQIPHIAAQGGNLEFLEDTSPEPRNIYNMTPLAVAANAGNFEAFKALVEFGHSLDNCDAEGRTVLCIAAGAGSKDIVEFVLKRKVNPNPYSLEATGQYLSPTYTALHAAAAGGHMDVVELLLKYNATPIWISNDCTPSQEAFKHGHQAVGQLLKDAEAIETQKLEKAERTMNMTVTADTANLGVMPTQLNTPTPRMERSQSQVPPALMSMTRHLSIPASRPPKRTYAQSEASTTPVDSAMTIGNEHHRR